MSSASRPSRERARQYSPGNVLDMGQLLCGARLGLLRSNDTGTDGVPGIHGSKEYPFGERQYR